MGIVQIPAPTSGLTYRTVRFTSSGTFSVPSTTTMVDVILIGGGAGGAGACSGTLANGNVGAGHGGAGCFMYVPNYPATPSGTISYTIGTAGAGGVASGTTATDFVGGVGGNTTFGGLVAPGGGAKVGANGSAMQKYQRGGFGVFGSWNSISTGQVSQGTSSATWLANSDATALGFPLGVPGAFVSYTDTYVGNSSHSIAAVYPGHIPSGNDSSVATYQNNFIGVKKSFNRILNDFTEPTGTAGSVATGGTAGAIFSGWNGQGSGGLASSSATTGGIVGYGGGGGGVIGANANLSAAGGAAATNSGSGGGGGAARAASSSMVNQLANGGAGGSGVIFLGYWA
jgi:hypothetical protein